MAGATRSSRRAPSSTLASRALRGVGGLALGTLWVGALLHASGCGSAPQRPLADEGPLVVSRPLRRALDEPQAEGSSTVALDRGSDVGRRVLFSLLDAMVRGDAHAMRRLLVEEPVAIQSLRLGHRAPAVFSPRRREDVVRALLAGQRAGRLPEGVALDELVDPSRVEVQSARLEFADETPGGLDPEDLVVRFPVEEQGVRAFIAIANQGRGVIIVRVEPGGARVVGL